MLSTMKPKDTNSICYLRSECRTEADREAVDKLFAHNWDYFVIKNDGHSNRMSTFLECCGTEFKLGS